MMGRIYEIVNESEKVSKIVLRKKVNNKIVPVAITVFGYWKERMLAMNLKPKDKIRANIYMKSRQWNDKWFTDVYFRGIDLLEKAPVRMGERSLFESTEEEPTDEFIDDDGNLIDIHSGEKIN